MELSSHTLSLSTCLHMEPVPFLKPPCKVASSSHLAIFSIKTWCSSYLNSQQQLSQSITFCFSKHFQRCHSPPCPGSPPASLPLPAGPGPNSLAPPSLTCWRTRELSSHGFFLFPPPSSSPSRLPSFLFISAYLATQGDRLQHNSLITPALSLL